MRNRLLLSGFLITGLASMASAQRGGSSGPRGQEGAGGDDPNFTALSARSYQPTRLERFSEMLRLNKDQQKGAKEIFDAAQKEAAPVRDQIQKSRGNLATAYLIKQSQPDIDQLVTAYGALTAQMTAIEMRAFAKLCDSLSPDQQKRVGPAFQLMAGMFNGRDWNKVGP